MRRYLAKRVRARAIFRDALRLVDASRRCVCSDNDRTMRIFKTALFPDGKIYDPI